jgi:hypothetical protein
MDSIHLVRKMEPEVTVAWVRKLMDNMRKLTVLSVSLQHADELQGILDRTIKEETEYLMMNKLSSEKISAVGFYKAIDCILMQIELDPIADIRDILDEERECLTFLIRFKRVLTDLIIETIPGYDEIPWEIN